MGRIFAQWAIAGAKATGAANVFVITAVFCMRIRRARDIRLLAYAVRHPELKSAGADNAGEKYRDYQKGSQAATHSTPVRSYDLQGNRLSLPPEKPLPPEAAFASLRESHYRKGFLQTPGGACL